MCQTRLKLSWEVNECKPGDYPLLRTNASGRAARGEESAGASASATPPHVTQNERRVSFRMDALYRRTAPASWWPDCRPSIPHGPVFSRPKHDVQLFFLE